MNKLQLREFKNLNELPVSRLLLKAAPRNFVISWAESSFILPWYECSYIEIIYIYAHGEITAKKKKKEVIFLRRK